VTVRGMLERSGHHVLEARDGVEGLACILAERPDVAIVALILPGIDGHEVASRSRAALGASLLLLAMTGHGLPGDPRRTLAAGFDAHMTRPSNAELAGRMLDLVGAGDDSRASTLAH